ncbi:MAG: M48 family metalloprotease, partial [Chloroflexota bacterium]|nr:M48 family metalloprotease [Chloroflexota bacterium]
VLMILAPILAQLIYFAVSRKREYLADASSALYTRYPEGLASALEKLATSNTQVKAANQATAPMYTINPFQKKGMSMSNLTSTHPPIAERIRILRSMAGVSPADYEQAYRKIKGKGIMPPSALTAAGTVGIRAASDEAGAVEEAPAKVERARETSDLMWRMSDYKTIDCDCGTRLRVPPAFRGRSIQCPHCGRIHQV